MILVTWCHRPLAPGEELTADEQARVSRRLEFSCALHPRASAGCAPVIVPGLMRMCPGGGVHFAAPAGQHLRRVLSPGMVLYQGLRGHCGKPRID